MSEDEEPKNERSNCEILRTIFQPMALSSDIQQARKRFIYFITLQLISTRILSRGKEKKVSGDHSTFVAKQIQFSLLDFITL